MTKEQLERVVDLVKDFDLRWLSEVMNLSFECSECPFGGTDRSCPYLKEIQEVGDKGDYINSCQDVFLDYISTGKVVDRRGGLSRDI